MPLLELSTVITTIWDIGRGAAIDKAKRSETIIRILRKLGLQSDVTPPDFDSVYVHALVEYGIEKPKPILDFFRHEFINWTSLHSV